MVLHGSVRLGNVKFRQKMFLILDSIGIYSVFLPDGIQACEGRMDFFF